MKRLKLILLWLCSVPTWAAGNLIDEDSELLQGARLLYHQAPKVQEYRLVLSEIKKINNLWRTEKELKLNARVERKTYQLSEDKTFRESLPLFETLPEAKDNVRQLFSCSGLDCGSSNGWANEFFNIKQLYGLDYYQSYAVWLQQGDDGRRVYYVTYLVQRGNRRVYLQQDIIVPRQDELSVDLKGPLNIAKQLQEQGYLVLPFSVQSEFDAYAREVIAQLANYLKTNPGERITLVGHDYSGADRTQRQGQSQQYAESVAQALNERGNFADRVRSAGVGALAPARKDSEARVEVVLDP